MENINENEINAFDIYDKFETTDIFDDGVNRMICVVLGLNGEACEVAEKFKKIFRGDVKLDKDSKKQIAFELGDILWYLSRCASVIDYKLKDIAVMNMEKLKKRLRSNKIKGSGDLR